MDTKGYYALFDISEDATYHEIKRSYRKLARKYHPDRNKSAFAEDMIKKINEAFEVLSDRDKRSEYNDLKYTVYMPDTSGQYQTEDIHDPDHNHYSEFHFNFGHTKSDRSADKKDPSDNLVSHSIEIPRGRFHISVEPSLCMAFGSCEVLAPMVFVVEKNKRINPKARVQSETGADFDTILASAQTCPTKAIKIVDRLTGEQIYP